MSKFKKGQIANPKGRTKGAANKVTQDTRKIFKAMMEEEMPFIRDALEELREEGSAVYLRAITGLMPYFLPKVTEIEMKVSEVVKPPTWFGLDAEDVDEV